MTLTLFLTFQLYLGTLTLCCYTALRHELSVVRYYYVHTGYHGKRLYMYVYTA